MAAIPGPARQRQVLADHLGDASGIVFVELAT
jgi:hypothetical protein